MSEATDTIDPALRTETEFETRFAVVLSNPSRKRILSALTGTDEQMTLGELASAITDQDAGDRSTRTGDGIVRRTTATLYHRDLPKLAATGFVEWDAESRLVALTSDGAAYADAFGL